MTYWLKNSINLKKWNKIATLSLASLLAINGCGGDSGWWGGWTTVESENISFSLKSNNPIAGTVEIRSAKWDVLLTGLQSDNSWNIQIKQDEFDSMLNQYSLDNSDFIEVYTIDQGTVNSYSQSYSSMNMSVSALLKSSDLDRAVIWPVSKFVHNLILQHENYNSDISSAEIQNIIDETLKKVALSDINHDGIINNSDVINYDMSAFESGLETVLRDSWYLDLLENGNENEIAEKQEIIMQLQENLSVTNHESEYNWTANWENGTWETYVPVELETIKTELEWTLSASLAELNQLDNQLSTTQSQQNQLSNEIENQKNSISQHSNNLNNLADFERKISNIDFRNDSDSTLKSKIDTLPNIQQISRNIAPMMARTVSTQSDMVFLSAAPYSDSEKLPQLQERKNQLKSEILEVLRKIQDINQSISEKQNDISRKNTEIQNEESVLIENQRIVDEYQQKIVEFQNRNKTEIDNYRTPHNNYIANVRILKREGLAKNLWLDIGGIAQDVWDAAYTWSAVQERAENISKPNRFSYTTDRNSKNYSDLFSFDETIVDYFGTKLVAKMHYGYESDYPAIMELYKNGTYLWRNTWIRNESHKNDLKEYYWAHLEKSLVKGILQEMIAQENQAKTYYYIILELAKVELDWVNKRKEFTRLKESIQPKIDALQSLKRDLERAKNILENEKQEKRNLEELKKELVGKLAILQGQINEISTTKITIENILNNLEEDLKNKEEDYEINQQNLVEINDNKNSIEITITTTEKDLEELNNQINQTSDKWQKYSFKEIIWWKVFEFEVISSVEWWETKEVMQQKWIEKFEEIKKNIISNEFYFSDGSSYVVYSYFPQWKGNFPAYIWWSYNLYGKSRTTESYLVNSQDQIDLLGNSLKSTVERNVIQNAFNSEKIDINDGLHDGLSSYPRVHYYNNNSNEKFPATVSLELKLGNYSFYKHNPKLLYSQEDIDNEIGEMNANISTYKSKTKVNAWEPIWIVDKLTPMVWGAYHIYEFDGKYIATWKVANKWTWRFGGLRDNPYELEDELIRILDDWQYRNSTEPTNVDDDRSPAEMKEQKVEEINEFKTPQITFDNLYIDYQKICQENNSNQAPLVGPWSIHLNDEQKFTYSWSCNSDPRRLKIEKKMEKILKSSAQFWFQYAIYNVNNHSALSEQRQAWFKKWVTDWIIGIISQPKELAKAWWAGIVETKEWLEKFAHFFIGLPLIYGYDALVDNETSNKILQNAKQDISIRWRETRLEIESVIDDFTELKNDIDFLLENLHTIHPKQAAYYRWYLEGVFSTLIWEAIALTYITKNGKAVSKKILTSDNGKKITRSIKKMMQDINITKEVYRITRSEVDLKIVKILENWRSVYGDSFNDSLKSSLILWDKHWIRIRTLYHLINWEWSEGWFFKWGLHSPKRVEELLEKWKIRVQAQPWGTWTNWEFVDYDTYINLNEEQRSLIRINWTNRNKTLFTSDWSDEDIALLIREAELNIRDILTEKWLPLTWVPRKPWKDTLINNVPIGNITHIFNINGKTIKIRLWWRYDQNRNIDYTIVTLFPN